MNQIAPRTLLISRFHVKHAAHCVGIASAQSGLRCTVSSVILMRRCGGGCIHNPSEGVKPPAAWLRAEHQRPAHAIRCTTGFYSSRRNARGTLASYSSLGDERYLPRERPSILFPDAGMNPASIDGTPPAESEREISSATDAVSRETSPAQAQCSCAYSVWWEEPSGLLLSSISTGDARRNSDTVHSGTDPAALRTAGLPMLTLPGDSRCLPRGRGW